MTSGAQAPASPERRQAARHVAPVPRLRGTVRVPGDKSISHRAALFNALADGAARIHGYSDGADCASTLACLAALGVPVHHEGSLVEVTGQGLRGGLREPTDVLDCGNSGTTLRLLAGLLAGQDLFAVLTGDASLRHRPMARVIAPLAAMGACLRSRDGNRLPPLVVLPAGTLRGASHQLPVASAQVKSALLLAGLLADSETSVAEPTRSRDHTERLLRAMGADVEVEGARVTTRPAERLRAVDVDVPGDFSSAAFWLVLATMHPDAEVWVEHVGLNPTRTGLLDILAAMGAPVAVLNVRDEAGEPVGDLVARSCPLRGTEVAGEVVTRAIDELPLVALLGLGAEGETVVRDAAELKVKESDRIAAVAQGLGALGGRVEERADGWRLERSHLVHGAVDSLGDHRVAMLLALAGALGDGVDLRNAEAVGVSYPGFWDTLRALAS